MFGAGDVRFVQGRTMLGLEGDIIARVDMVHRCGTDASMFRIGRPEPLEASLVAELREILGADLDLGARSGPLARLFIDGVEEGAPPAALAYRRGLAAEAREALRRELLSGWGRVIGHEFVATIVHVGSGVNRPADGIGYLAGTRLQPRFEMGQRVTVQTRVAAYRPPVGFGSDGPDVRGVQLLGGDILNMAMTYDGAYADYVRLCPEFIASGSVLPIPDEVDSVEAALVEPAACMLDCLEKGTHEVGQSRAGVMHKKGVMLGGVAAVIGSGSMALLAGRLALASPEDIEVGGARQVVFLVRSAEKADLVARALGDRRVATVIAPPDASADDVTRCVHEQYGPQHQEIADEPFGGFDDIIVAAPGALPVQTATKLVGVGGRIYSFAGAQGPIAVESGLWHYRNAGTVGSSGCNTRMMEIVLDLVAERRLKLVDLSGRRYRLSELAADPRPFFEDTRLRPCLLPQE
jgi:threonine dehydrogenase-like Zn-dependent dehydrogenase